MKRVITREREGTIEEKKGRDCAAIREEDEIETETEVKGRNGLHTQDCRRRKHAMLRRRIQHVPTHSGKNNELGGVGIRLK